jgi:hypothetical protein
MQRLTIIGLTTLATLALVCVGAVSVSASGSEFVASKTGKVKDKQTGMQVFNTSGGPIECAEASGSGEVTATTFVTIKETINYKACSGFGDPVKISTANLEFNANGTAKIEKQIIVKVEGSAGCEAVIEPQTLEKLVYSNAPIGDITATAKVKTMKVKGSSNVCEANEATYNGGIASELEGGGTLEWK